MKILNSSLTCVKGVKAVGKHVGIKKERKDCCIIHLGKLASCAAVFTQNSVKAAPLLVDIENLKKSKGKAQALFVVSGVANACTGEKGFKDAKKMCEIISKELSIKKTHVFIGSTGVIGKFLPMGIIEKGVKGISDELSSSNESGLDATKAIMTTDTKMKTAAIDVDGVKFAGIAKGSGMIHPNMATMLCYIFTDGIIKAASLKKALKAAVNKSFNMISVDGCTSTNDTVAAFANGMSGKGLDNEKLQNALDFICFELCKKVVSDGEGATKIFEVHVKNAKNKALAREMVKAVISSNLVKTAVYGKDPNWGRIAQALGQSGTPFNFYKTDISLEDVKIVENGVGKNFDLKKVKSIMGRKEFRITIDLKQGKGKAVGWGCDLTEGYIKENAIYTT